jgi:hypothetical protein
MIRKFDLQFTRRRSETDPYREHSEERREGLHALPANRHQSVRAGTCEGVQIFRGRTDGGAGQRDDGSLQRGYRSVAVQVEFESKL